MESVSCNSQLRPRRAVLQRDLQHQALERQALQAPPDRQKAPTVVARHAIHGKSGKRHQPGNGAVQPIERNRQGSFLAEHRILYQRVDRAPVVQRHAIAQIERHLLQVAQIGGQPECIFLLRRGREQRGLHILVRFDQTECARQFDHRLERIFVIVAVEDLVQGETQQPG